LNNKKVILFSPNLDQFLIVGSINAIPTLLQLRPECRRRCSTVIQNILRSSWMLVGITPGSIRFVQSIRSTNGIAVNKVIGGMFSGMVLGMVVSIGSYRLFFISRNRLDQNSLAAAGK